MRKRLIHEGIRFILKELILISPHYLKIKIIKNSILTYVSIVKAQIFFLQFFNVTRNFSMQYLIPKRSFIAKKKEIVMGSHIYFISTLPAAAALKLKFNFKKMLINVNKFWSEIKKRTKKSECAVNC